ncbi:MAG: NAD-dependent epimerase/dehydratase family protein [Beijerinckiaceae bacterium]
MSLLAHDLVVGADGFLGKNFIRVLGERGRIAAGIGRAAGDLSDWAICEQAFKAAPKVERIFHVVTRQRTGAVQYGIQGEMLAINARIHLNVLEAWRLYQPQAKLISTGSSCVYPERDTPLGENAYQTGPLHPSVKGYGLAKQVLGIGAQVYAEQYGLRQLHCILATVFGPGDHKAPDRSHFLGAMLDRAVQEMRAGQTRFTVWGDPNTVRELLYVDDQIDAILAADGAFENDLLNCAAATPVTVGEAARAITRAIGWDAEIYSPPESFSGAGYKVLDSSRFLNATGWCPKYDLLGGIRRLYELEYLATPAD